MKKLLLMILTLLTVSVWSASRISTLDDFAEAVRIQTGIHSTDMLPDSSLWDMSSQALKVVSRTVGGYEYRYRFVSAVGKNFYKIPDSIAKVLSAQILTRRGETHALKAWLPQYYDAFSLPSLDASSDDQTQTPVAYDVWADSIQLMPTPVSVDTICLVTWMEHPAITTGGTILMEDDFTDAAVLLACGRVLQSVKLYDEAQVYLSEYKQAAQELIQGYARRMDILQK
jgi:hypothetical protein